MVWVLVATVYVGALCWSWRQHKKVTKSQDIRLDFGDQVDGVEPALRLLASHAQWQGLYLNVYISASDDEARAIAYRLGSSMPLNLVLEHFPEDSEMTTIEGVDVLLRAQTKDQV